MKTNRSGIYRIFAAVCMGVLMILALSACASQHPEADIQTYCEAVIHGDEASAKKLGLSADKIAGTERKQTKETMSMMMQAVAPGAKDNKEMENATNAMYDTLKRLSIKTELISKTDSTAKVKITTDYINYPGLIKSLLPQLQTKISDHMDEINAISDQDQKMNMLLVYSFQCLGEGLKSAEIQGQQSFEAECRYNKDKNMWVPADEVKFGQELMKNMLFPSNAG